MPTIETLLLANHAEAINGLLYLSGAGWTDHWRPARPPDASPPVTHIGVGLTVLVGWNEANQKFPLVLSLEDQDGREQILRIEAEFEAGRPPGVPQGTDLRQVLALSGEVTFPHEGRYRLVAQAGEATRSVSFQVHDAEPPRP